MVPIEGEQKKRVVRPFEQSFASRLAMLSLRPSCVFCSVISSIRTLEDFIMGLDIRMHAFLISGDGESEVF